jgi:uncharacterized protein (TIGR00255 family)
MLLSMTGYGRAYGNFGEKTIMVEARALNSKMTDLKIRLPGDYREKELELRKLVTDHAERGKIDIVVEVQNADGAAAVTLNEALFKGYYRELTRLSQELGIERGDVMQAILRIPNIVATPTAEVDDDEWGAICQTVTRALDQMRHFRRNEGKVLEADLCARIEQINRLLTEVIPFEQARMVKMRERLRNNLEENFATDNVDKNRYEQEILYYMEKIDMSEEKLRLEQHCKYFLEQVGNQQQSAGRTLNFISQELGREINTLGAKAYDADIQRIVVQMKDELEKIKEQIANVL